MDMRAGAERLMSCVVQTTGGARAHHGYLFANARATRIKLLVHDGFGVWCAARRLNAGHFAWPRWGGEGLEGQALERYRHARSVNVRLLLRRFESASAE